MTDSRAEVSATCLLMAFDEAAASPINPRRC